MKRIIMIIAVVAMAGAFSGCCSLCRSKADGTCTKKAAPKCGCPSKDQCSCKK